jgi:hypothetical protein
LEPGHSGQLDVRNQARSFVQQFGLKKQTLVSPRRPKHRRRRLQSVAFVAQHYSLRAPEANYRERNRSIARASESVKQRERGHWTLVEDAFDFG